MQPMGRPIRINSSASYGWPTGVRAGPYTYGLEHRTGQNTAKAGGKMLKVEETAAAAAAAEEGASAASAST